MTDLLDYKDALEREGKIIHHIKGISMLPMLRQGKDTVIIEKIKDPPKVNDVLFYKRNDGACVLHRLIKIKKDGSYVIRGDNCRANEYDITDSHIIGVLTDFYRGQKLIICKTSKGYKFYMLILPFIRKTKSCYWFLLKCLSKIKRTLLKFISR